MNALSGAGYPSVNARGDYWWIPRTEMKTATGRGGCGCDVGNRAMGHGRIHDWYSN